QVSIGRPVPGAQLAAGESLLVSATAVGPDAFLLVELWVDGVLAGVHAAPSGGALAFSTHFYWLPIEPGAHSLIAAAIDSEEEKTMSAQVIVYVTPDESRGEILTSADGDFPTVLPAPDGDSYGAPGPPDDNESIGPAGGWSGSPGDWVNSITADEKPAAPELVGTTECCGSTLSIHDLSSNEEGFAIYRQSTNTST
ncbi:MAG: hypothetical protein MUO76_04015, partial [Anaerolineaceae bacterium]|nr:hypothetical protein [Anaerolineaceae bacterium]